MATARKMDPGGNSRPNIGEIWAQIVERCWEDEKFKQRVIANPKEVLREYGFENPNWKYVVIEEKERGLKYYLSMPKKPESESKSEESLKNISAGGNTGQG